jgi:phosphopantetheinyl transferase
MPLIFKEVNNSHSIACWKHTEDISFFEEKMSYRSNASHPERKKQQLSSRMAIFELDSHFPFDQVEHFNNGKPILKSSAIAFSLTHAKEIAGAIISQNGQVGIDIEKISDRVLKIEQKFLHREELALLPINKPERVRLATLLWTVKETVYKCFGISAVDFSHDICIKSIDKDLTSITIDFKPLQITGSKVFCHLIEEHWLSYMIHTK